LCATLVLKPSINVNRTWVPGINWVEDACARALCVKNKENATKANKLTNLFIGSS
jgi:hypothetical protein